MKKTSASQRALTTHFEVLTEFLQSLTEMFPDCKETKDALLYVGNVCKDDPKLMREGVGAWCDNLLEPLVKGSAKYMKAVESITGKPACVYHAFSYRDVTAMEASSSSEMLKRLDLSSKLKDEKFTDEIRATFWEYMDELSKTAHDALEKEDPRRMVPVVPTREQIQKDIAKRKSSGGSSTGDSSHTIAQGVVEAIHHLFKVRGVSPSEAGDQASERLLAAHETRADRIRMREDAAYLEMLREAFPTTSWRDTAVTDDEWSTLHKVVGLGTMQDAIPAPMMAGIETVANKLMKDISEGRTDMSKLNIESIGKEVLSGVSSKDMNDFAGNMDKILPVLQGLKPF